MTYKITYVCLQDLSLGGRRVLRCSLFYCLGTISCIISWINQQSVCCFLFRNLAAVIHAGTNLNSFSWINAGEYPYWVSSPYWSEPLLGDASVSAPLTAQLLTPVSCGINRGPAGMRCCTCSYCRRRCGRRKVKNRQAHANCLEGTETESNEGDSGGDYISITMLPTQCSQLRVQSFFRGFISDTALVDHCLICDLQCAIIHC